MITRLIAVGFGEGPSAPIGTPIRAILSEAARSTKRKFLFQGPSLTQYHHRERW